jgi:hypothetical protein
MLESWTNRKVYVSHTAPVLFTTREKATAVLGWDQMLAPFTALANCMLDTTRIGYRNQTAENGFG